MVITFGYTFRIISGTLKCTYKAKIVLADYNNAVTTITYEISAPVDITRISDSVYVKELVKNLNTQITKLHSFITGRINNILDLSPLTVAELKSALKDPI